MTWVSLQLMFQGHAASLAFKNHQPEPNSMKAFQSRYEKDKGLLFHHTDGKGKKQNLNKPACNQKHAPNPQCAYLEVQVWTEELKHTYFNPCKSHVSSHSMNAAPQRTPQRKQNGRSSRACAVTTLSAGCTAFQTESDTISNIHLLLKSCNPNNHLQ